MTDSVPKTGNPGNKLPQYVAALAGNYTICFYNFFYLFVLYFSKEFAFAINMRIDAIYLQMAADDVPNAPRVEE